MSKDNVTDNYDLVFKKQIEDLDRTALDIADAKVGHSHYTDEELFNTQK